MAQCTDLIKENIAPSNANVIGVYNSSNERVGKINLGNLKSTLGNKLYSFGALSDTHIGATTANTDFQTALTWLKNEGVAFSIICGDTCNYGTEENFQTFKNLIDTYANYPVYATNGNHELNTSGFSESLWNTYVQNSMDYCFTYNNDVFILLGAKGTTYTSAFNQSQQTWLEELIEKYKNCRIFLFTHYYINGTNNGNFNNLYSGNVLTTDNTYGSWLFNIMKNNKNIILFTGHSHFKWDVQTACKTINICNKVNEEETGYFVHLPSVALPRDKEGNKITEDAEGGIVDVYEDCIVIRGKNFIQNKLLPIAYYKLPVMQGSLPNITYNITNTLSNATNSNNATSISSGSSYMATISPDINYNIESITVTMGGVDITSTAVSGNAISISNVTGDIVITVITASTVKPCTNITLSSSTLTFTDKTPQTLTATITPSDSTDEIIWSVSPSGICTVNNGVITPVSSGSCVVTATCGNQTATCNVTVNIAVPTINLELTRNIKIDTSTGAESTGAKYFVSNNIEYVEGYTYKLNRSAITDVVIGTYTLSIVYYDANSAFMSSSTNLITNSTDSTDTSVVIPVPSGAKYIRLRGSMNNADAYYATLSPKISITVE